MANDFNKEEVVLFEQVLEKFDADNTVAKEAAYFTQGAQSLQRSGDTVWRPQPQISTTVSGLDVSSSIGSVTGLSVPATVDITETVPWEFDAYEARDKSYRDRKADSAAQALSAIVNRSIAGVVGNQGSLVVAQTGALTGYDDISLADTVMIENDVRSSEKAMVLNARDYNAMSGNLADRTLQPRSERALSTTSLGPVSGFNTFKTSYMPRLQGASWTTTVSGAGQNYVPQSTVPNAAAGPNSVSNVDNRFQDLTVTSSAGMVAGDAFTIAGVNSLSHINKADTGQLKTFRVVEVIDGTTIKITPPMIDAAAGDDASIDYANVTAAAADTAAITPLNSTSTLVNAFWCNDSIEIFGGNLAFDEDMAGVAVMRQSTDSGVEIIYAKQGDAKTGKSFYRLTIFFGVTNLNPEMNGILIGGQV